MFYQKMFVSIKILVFTVIFFSTIYSSEKSPFKNKIIFINGNPITQINSKNIKLDNENNTLYLNNSLKNFFASYYVNENGIQIDEAYYFKKHNNFKIKIGKFSIDHFYKNDLSTGDMIDSGNALGLKRYYLEYSKYLGQFEIKASLSDGIMDKNSINLKSPFIHDKRFFIKNKGFSIGLIHNVIWGGELEFYGKQPSKLDDYFRIFAGQGGSEDALLTDQGNALGNAFGLWDFRYIKKINDISINTYHQTYFEDRSGLELKNEMSKFDGLTGISVSYNNFRVLLEYLKTTYQGGNVHPPGLDSFYYNGIYRNGYVFKGRTVGNIFINPQNNRFKVKHIAFENKFNKTFVRMNYTDIKDYDISYKGFPASGKVDISKDTYSQFSEKSIFLSRKIKQYNLGFYIEKKQKEINIISQLTFEF
tara:strand:- start:1082 stop:2338 length:1257 start_codon:yes stop_codon:yes gene_type:complete